jgi:hypothetical protein
MSEWHPEYRLDGQRRTGNAVSARHWLLVLWVKDRVSTNPATDVREFRRERPFQSNDCAALSGKQRSSDQALYLPKLSRGERWYHRRITYP